MGNFLIKTCRNSLNLFLLSRDLSLYNGTCHICTPPSLPHWISNSDEQVCSHIIVVLLFSSDRRHQALQLLSLEEVQAIAFVTLLRWTRCHTQTPQSRRWKALTVAEEACYAPGPAWTWKWIWRFIYSSFFSWWQGGRYFFSHFFFFFF